MVQVFLFLTFLQLIKIRILLLISRLYGDENHLFTGEYHQAFKNSNLLTDFGYTKGYKKTTSSKKAGDKSHFFQSILKVLKEKIIQIIL